MIFFRKFRLFLSYNLESMSVLRVFLTADSEFAIENLPKPKGKPEIDAREKRTLFSRFFAV